MAASDACQTPVQARGASETASELVQVQAPGPSLHPHPHPGPRNGRGPVPGFTHVPRSCWEVPQRRRGNGPVHPLCAGDRGPRAGWRSHGGAKTRTYASRTCRWGQCLGAATEIPALEATPPRDTCALSPACPDFSLVLSRTSKAPAWSLRASRAQLLPGAWPGPVVREGRCPANVCYKGSKSTSCPAAAV